MDTLNQELSVLVKKGKIPSFVAEILRKFYVSYKVAVEKNHYSFKELEPLLLQLLKFVVRQISHPHRFDLYHRKVRKPFDYYQFGLDFIRPLIEMKRTKVEGVDVLTQAQHQIEKGENVIFLANHQIEPDPQVISVLIEKTHPKIADELIFVAGHRVVTDPLAVPFSLGCNLLCIYSKKHVQYPPEQKAEKLVHNQRTMKKLAHLLQEGGKCIYVAPSGGRDRPDESGKIVPARFDPQSIEMFLLLAKKSKTPTHFYPLTLATYKILPPPKAVEREIGEKRHAECAPVYLHFGPEVDLNAIGAGIENKQEKRDVRADILWTLVKQAYENQEAL